jgi:hypothetical protein
MCAFYHSEIGYDTFAISHWLTELLAYLTGGSILLQVRVSERESSYLVACLL